MIDRSARPKTTTSQQPTGIDRWIRKDCIPMTYDHRSTTLHRAELDREIDAIRTERLIAGDPALRPGPLDRVRRAVGRALIAAGTALIGREAKSLRIHRA